MREYIYISRETILAIMLLQVSGCSSVFMSMIVGMHVTLSV